MQSFLFYAKILIFMHEPPIVTPYLLKKFGGSTGEGVFIAIFIIGLANSQMKTGRKTLDFLSKPLLVFAKHRRKLASLRQYVEC